MGLDIAFNKEAALAAGLVVIRQKNGSDEAIAAAEISAAAGEDDGYLEYLKREDEYIQVPNRNWMVEGSGSDEEFIVRANKWGDTYAPLTEWLKAKGIDWSEF